MDKNAPWLYNLAWHTYGRIFVRRNKIKLVNDCGVDISNGPFLLLSNHVGAYDPVIISCILRRHVSWVAGAYLFKKKFLGWVLGKGCAAIPKQQGRADASSVRQMQNMVKKGYIVGLFPEGTRTWDGEMMNVELTTLSKLIRMLKVPVLFVNLEGGFAQQPRWSDHPRKGSVTVNLRHAIKADELAQLELEQIKDIVKENLSFSNDEWKTEENYHFADDFRAEGLQRLMYMCPCCNGIATMKTKENKISCTGCGASALLDDMDNLVSVDIPFKHMSQWHRWESDNVLSSGGFAPEPGVLFQRGNADHDGKLEDISFNTEVSLKDDAIKVKCLDASNEFVLCLDKITSLILNAKQTIELFCDDVLYRIRLLPDASSLKYQEYFLAYKERNGK